MHPRNHDMDDLFRRAAARYPLKPADSDWDVIARKLQTADKPSFTGGPFQRRKYLALLLVLIPGGFIFHNSLTGIGGAKNSDDRTLIPVSSFLNTTVVENKKYTNKKRTVHSKRLSEPITPGPAVYNDRIAATMPSSISFDTGISIQRNKKLEKDVLTTAEKTSGSPEKQATPVKGLYLGAVGGLDLGIVKGQSATKPGFNLGMIAGYRFSKHWSFETGISYTRKKYFTRGEYFSMKKIESSMPNGMEMVAVQGRLSLFEIPYKIKYDFRLKERSNYFITAGGSTNIYVKETNEYLTNLNGVPELHHGTYRDLHCSPLCLVHISAGYEQTLRGNSRFRLEPYLKIPLRKVGMGSVPVLSVGLNVSVLFH